MYGYMEGQMANFHRPISIIEAAAAMGLSKSGITKAISSKRLLAIPLSGKGMMLSYEQCHGKKFSEEDFRKLCSKFVSVPEACDIVHKTDARVIRDLKAGIIAGFLLNGRAWAVDKRSAEQEFADYLANPDRVGQPRQIGTSRSPRVIRKKALHAKKSKVRSRPGGK
jgi:hypothetical protein